MAVVSKLSIKMTGLLPNRAKTYGTFTIYKLKKSLKKTYEKFIISEKMTFSHELPTFSFANLFLLSNSQSNKEFAILFQTY